MATRTISKFMNGSVESYSHTDSNFTGTIYVKKIGPLVEVSAYNIKPNSAIAAGGELSFGTMPQAFRPTTAAIVRGYAGKGSRNGALTIGGSSGNMIFYNASDSNMTTSSTIDIGMTYFHE